MTLLQLPAELRLQIYECLPELLAGRNETIAPTSRLTPAISRTNQQLRRETLPLYANAAFEIETNESRQARNDTLTVWLRALSPLALPHVQSLQLSRHWDILQPTRGEGHVGFYVRLQRAGHEWQCMTGTYPRVRDKRGMRHQSVELLQHIVRQNVLEETNLRDKSALAASDVHSIIAAIGVVASNVIPFDDAAIVKAGQQRCREMWDGMERQLYVLHPSNAAEMDR